MLMAASNCCEVDCIMSVKSKEICGKEYLCNGRILKFEKPLIMGIVNLTPDSFYDGGKLLDTSSILSDVEQKITAGAHIIDLGAASSRPGAPLLSADEEWSRLKNPLIALRKEFPDIFISIDTWQSTIAKRSAEHGADIINDISGGSLDKTMPDTIINLDLPYIMMHMDGTPATMAQNPPYANVAKTVKASLDTRCSFFRERNFFKIILDPGFGFGKSLQNNYQLLKQLSLLTDLGYPVLAGISRKSMISRVAGGNPVTALNGTTVLNTIALLNGASIIRVHDVAEARQVIDLVTYYKAA